MPLFSRRLFSPTKLRSVLVLVLLPAVVIYSLRYMVRRYECAYDDDDDCLAKRRVSTQWYQRASRIKAVQGNIVVNDADVVDGLISRVNHVLVNVPANGRMDNDDARDINDVREHVNERHKQYDDDLKDGNSDGYGGDGNGNEFQREPIDGDENAHANKDRNAISENVETKDYLGNPGNHENAHIPNDGEDNMKEVVINTDQIRKSDEGEPVEHVRDGDPTRPLIGHDGDRGGRGGGSTGNDLDVPKPNASLPLSNEPPVFVVVMTLWRFGSSVIGELFNKNPGIFYLYEPLMVVEDMVKLWRIPGPFSRETYYYSTKLLRDIAKCDFGDKFIDFVNLTNHEGGRVRNMAICSKLPSPKDCLIPDAGWLRDVCRRYTGTLAIKIIRGDLSMLKYLVDDEVNLKVIHLVRDPRGSVSSRLDYLYNWGQETRAHRNFSVSGRLEPLQLLSKTERGMENVPSICRWLRNNYVSATQVPKWLRGRYHLLRFEDFAEEPVRTTEQLYDFVGLNLPDVVREWVIRNTAAQSSAQGTFDTTKNAKETARRWMTDLSRIEIEQIESVCMDVMRLLGYKPFSILSKEVPRP